MLPHRVDVRPHLIKKFSKKNMVRPHPHKVRPHQICRLFLRKTKDLGAPAPYKNFRKRNMVRSHPQKVRPHQICRLFVEKNRRLRCARTSKRCARTKPFEFFRKTQKGLVRPHLFLVRPHQTTSETFFFSIGAPAP